MIFAPFSDLTVQNSKTAYGPATTPNVLIDGETLIPETQRTTDY